MWWKRVQKQLIKFPHDGCCGKGYKTIHFSLLSGERGNRIMIAALPLTI